MSDQRAEKHNLLFLMMTNRLNLITGFIGFSFFLRCTKSRTAAVSWRRSTLWSVKLWSLCILMLRRVDPRTSNTCHTLSPGTNSTCEFMEMVILVILYCFFLLTLPVCDKTEIKNKNSSLNC